MRVFISYSHDSDAHRSRVQKLAKRLRDDRVSVILDSDCGPGGPSEGWPAWSEAQVRDAERVLVVCTEIYCRRYEAKDVSGSGLGSVCEARAIRQLLYEEGGINERFRVVHFEEGDRDHVPLNLKAYHRFSLFRDESYPQLLGWLRGERPEIAPVEVLETAVAWPSADPDYPWRLADRKVEFALLQDILAADSVGRVLLLRGKSNSGKTALLREISEYARHLGVAASHIDLKGCPTLDDVLESLLLDLGAELANARVATGTARSYQVLSDLQQLKAPTLLVFDTYEQVSEDTGKWLESQLLSRLDRAPALRVVIGGKETPEARKHRWEGLAAALDVEPIDQVDDWFEFCQRTWECPQLERAHVVALTLTTGGDPGQMSALLEALVGQLGPDPA